MSNRNSDKLRSQHLESFLRLSLDPIWCYELTSPMSIKLPIDEQVEYMFTHSFVRDCNLSAAHLYGFSSEKEMIGKDIREFLPEQAKSSLRNFIESNYRQGNQEYAEVRGEGTQKLFQLNVFGHIEDGYLLRSWGIQKEITQSRESESKLKNLLKFSEVVNSISQLFMGTRSENIYESISKALEIVGAFSNASRAFVAEISQDRTSLSTTSEWLLPSVPSLFKVGTNLPISKMNPERLGILAGNGSIDIQDTSLLVTEPWHIALFSNAKVRSILVVGLRDEGNLIGIIGITSYQEVKIFSEEAKQLLNVVAGLVSQIIVRSKNEIKLKSKEKALQRFYSDIKEDLALAKLTQEAWVTSVFPEIQGVKIHSRFLPYEQIGGDLILCEKANDGSVFVFFGDISGHGISSALVSGIVAVSFKKYANGINSPKIILKSIHDELIPLVRKHHISACVFKIEPQSKTVTFSFAGHPPALFWNEGKNEISLIRDDMYPILLMDDWEGKEIVRNFKFGDRFLFYSDGIYELEEEGKGYVGLDEFLQEAKEIIEISNDSMEIFRKLITNCLVDRDRIIHDDIAILMVEF